MKKNLKLLSIFFVSAIFIASSSYFSVKYISVEDAVNKGIASVEFSGKGGYSGECVVLKIKNISDKDTVIRIEPGRRLVSADSSVQDILIIRELLLHLKGGEEQTADIFGFCCQSSNKGPRNKEVFSVGYMADSSWIKLAEFFNLNSYPVDIIQSSVWVMSNNHAINSVNGADIKDKRKMGKLYKLLSDLKGLEYDFPWYTLSYVQDTSVVFSGKPDVLYGEVEYSLPNYSVVDITIRNESGSLIETLVNEQAQQRDKYTYKFNLRVRDYKPGKYFLRI